MLRMFWIVLCMATCLCLYPAHNVQQSEEKDFIASFINNYGFTPESRDTHEYHSFILGKTRTSFERLEDHLRANHFDVAGRVVICGFQADAVPSYYTFEDHLALDDESSQKTKAGWQFAPGNIFGYLTGFLLKDAQRPSCPVMNSSCSFEYVLGQKIGLFDDRAQLFHKHAFGNGYALLEALRKPVNKALAQGNAQVVLHILHEFWRTLYGQGVCDGQGKPIATQDILFSIHYARYLMRSQAKIFNFFVGPDITYPIEVLPCQSEGVTQAAQNFVQRFVDVLQPRNQESTAYIFCSFVDGVGKSTLLGNLKNWAQYGTNFAAYERVDNASSQRATLFTLKENVALVDLPAQVSHFTIKPDGFVYVNIDTVKSVGATQRQNLERHIQCNAPQLIQEFVATTNRVARLSPVQLIPDVRDTPEMMYAKQCRVLGVDAPWIAGTFDGISYLFHRDMPGNIKILQPLEGVHSYGLKSSNPEHMIFSKGLTLPLGYDFFLDDVADQLRAAGVKKIVLVDFISMYPRTSRENIRVNFIIQQLKYLLGDQYMLEKSLYKGFVSSQELYSLMLNHADCVHQGLVQETCMRFALYKLIEAAGSDALTVIDSNKVSHVLGLHYEKILAEHGARTALRAKNKIRMEDQELGRQYGHDKNFQAITCFNADHLIAFSRFIHDVCARRIKDPYINALWAEMDNPVNLETIYSFDPSCRDKAILASVLSFVRVHWYQVIANVLKLDDSWRLRGDHLYVPPVMVIKGGDGMVRVVRKRLPLAGEHEQKVPSSAKGLVQFWSQFPTQWGLFEGKLHPMDDQAQKTYAQVYAYGYDSLQSRTNVLGSTLALLSSLAHDGERYGRSFVSTSDLASALQQKNLWSAVVQELKTANQGQPSSAKGDAIISLEPVRLAVRAFATLEMIAKDPRADCMVRMADRKDFIASAILFERITLPVYFNLQSKTPLFAGCANLVPVITGLI